MHEVSAAAAAATGEGGGGKAGMQRSRDHAPHLGKVIANRVVRPKGRRAAVDVERQGLQREEGILRHGVLEQAQRRRPGADGDEGDPRREEENIGLPGCVEFVVPATRQRHGQIKGYEFEVMT